MIMSIAIFTALVLPTIIVVLSFVMDVTLRKKRQAEFQLPKEAYRLADDVEGTTLLEVVQAAEKEADVESKPKTTIVLPNNGMEITPIFGFMNESIRQELEIATDRAARSISDQVKTMTQDQATLGYREFVGDWEMTVRVEIDRKRLFDLAML
jgi:hypothetical protein